jgi:hypothetical protein
MAVLLANHDREFSCSLGVDGSDRSFREVSADPSISASPRSEVFVHRSDRWADLGAHHLAVATSDDCSAFQSTLLDPSLRFPSDFLPTSFRQWSLQCDQRRFVWRILHCSYLRVLARKIALEGMLHDVHISLTSQSDPHRDMVVPNIQIAEKPNKAPEPTTMAVTPRAISRVIEMKPQTDNRHAARGAPAMVVAHL